MASPMKFPIARYVEAEWLHGETAQSACPNCGYRGEVKSLLAIHREAPNLRYRAVMQICPRCDVHFVDNLPYVDYEIDDLIAPGWPSYYAQVGAGLYPISMALARINKPAGARTLEIGGAYGFGLDFCVHGRGWRGIGFDPSPMAALGAQDLGLDIRRSYFSENNLGEGPWDVVLATEVIEHINEPPVFLRLMRQAVAPDGILMLTTPNAACIKPELSPAELSALLVPGAHVVMQTAWSLQLALEQAGFTHVLVQEDSSTLVAYAALAPFSLTENLAARRTIYRRYLAAQAERTELGSDLHLGFAGWMLFEAANDADAAGVETAWASLRTEVSKHFGYDLEGLTALPPGVHEGSIEDLARKMPMGLGMILFSRTMYQLSLGESRARLRPTLELAGQALAVLLATLRRNGRDEDMLSDSIARTIGQELLLCAAEAAEPESVVGLLARGNVLAGWRGFVALVNAGAFDLAAELKDGLLPGLPDEDIPAGVRRDALLSLANFYLAPGADAARVFPIAEALGEGGTEILLGGFTRLVNASRYEEALAAARRYNIPELAHGAGMAARDARLAQIVLDLAVGDPAEIPERLRGLEIEPEHRDGLLLEAFMRLVNASRYTEALAFIAAHDVSTLAARVGGEVAKNTGLARMVLDLAVGDPAEIPARFAGLEIEPARRDGLLLEAFIRLVNASRYDEALAFIATHDVSTLAARVGGEGAKNTGIARMVLDLAVGDPAEIPARLAGLEIEPERRDGLLLEAFIRLVNASRYDEALAFIATHDVSTLAARVGGEVAKNTGIARMVLDLAAGDPAEIPVRLRDLEIEPERRDGLLLEAFIRLVNASRYDEALAFIAAHDVSTLAARVGGEGAKNTGIARMVLDLAAGDPAEIPARLAGLEIEPERRDGLLLEAFIRLINASRYTEAQDFTATHHVPELLRRTGEKTGADAAIALAVLELELGDPALVPGHLAGLDVPPERAEALTLGAFTALVNTARYDEAEALAAAQPCFTRLPDMPGEAAADARFATMMLDLQRGRVASAVEKMAGLEQAGTDAATLGALYVDAFIRLMNDGNFAQAWQLAQEEGVERRLRHCTAPARQDALVALLLLELQAGGTAAHVPGRVTALRPTQISAAQLRELTLIAFTTLVNQQEFGAARALLAPVEPELLALRPPFDPAGRDALFAAGALYLEDEQEWRRGASCFGRLRDALAKSAPPGAAPEPLFWPALRGEVVALHRLERYEEATLLLREFIGTYPDAPEDLRQQIEPHETL